MPTPDKQIDGMLSRIAHSPETALAELTSEALKQNAKDLPKVPLESLAEGIDVSKISDSIQLLVGPGSLLLYRIGLGVSAPLIVGRFVLDSYYDIVKFTPLADEDMVQETLEMLNPIPFFQKINERFHMTVAPSCGWEAIFLLS